MLLSTIGLLLIAIAWLVQLYFVFKDDKEIKRTFIVMYMLGVALLVLDVAIFGSMKGTWTEILTFVAAGLVLIKISLKQKKKIVQNKKR